MRGMEPPRLSLSFLLARAILLLPCAQAVWSPKNEGSKQLETMNFVEEGEGGKSCVRPKLVVGFSTGHVGTTSLGKEFNYRSGACRLKDFEFHFEQNPFKAMEISQWYAKTVEGITTEERETCLAKKLKHFWESDGHTHVVMSHDALYYYRGILEVFPEDQLLFVRVRRDEDEFVSSWMGLTNQTYESHTYKLNPLIHEKEHCVQVKADTWKAMAEEDKARWFAKEVEARWQKLKQEHPNVPMLEVEWSKNQEGSFVEAINTVTTAMGLRPTKNLGDLKQHTGIPANDGEGGKGVSLLSSDSPLIPKGVDIDNACP